MAIASSPGPTQANLPGSTQANLSRSQVQSLSSPAQSAAATSNATTPASQATVESLIRDLEMNAAQCLERLQLLLDSVTDAVIQTQDVSAVVQEWKTGGANTVEALTLSSVLFDAMLLVGTEGIATVVDKVLVAVVKDTLTKLFNHNEVFAAVTTAAAASVVKGGTGLNLDVSGWEDIGDKFGVFSHGIRKAGEEGFSNLGKKLANAVKAKEPGKPPSGDGTDMPRAAITRGVQNYVSAHRLALSIEVSQLKYAIGTGLISIPAATQLIQSLAIADAGESLEKLRADLARGFELLIWERIYDTQLSKAKFSPPDPSSSSAAPEKWEALPSVTEASFLDPNVCMKGVPGKLVDYWRARYRSAIDDRKSSDGSSLQPTVLSSLQSSPKISNAYNDVRILYQLLQESAQALSKQLGDTNAGALGTLLVAAIPKAAP